MQVRVHAAMGGERVPEVQVEQPAQIVQILLPDGEIKAELVTDRGDFRPAGPWARIESHWIGRDHMREEERHDRDAEHDEDEKAEPAKNEPAHGCGPSPQAPPTV